MSVLELGYGQKWGVGRGSLQSHSWSRLGFQKELAQVSPRSWGWAALHLLSSSVSCGHRATLARELQEWKVPCVCLPCGRSPLCRGSPVPWEEQGCHGNSVARVWVLPTTGAGTMADLELGSFSGSPMLHAQPLSPGDRPALVKPFRTLRPFCRCLRCVSSLGAWQLWVPEPSQSLLGMGSGTEWEGPPRRWPKV